VSSRQPKALSSKKVQHRRNTSFTKEIVMNKDTIEGNWKQLKGKVVEQWGKLTDDDIDVVAGRRDQLAGKVQQRYGIAKDEAEKQVAAWERSATDDWFTDSDQPLKTARSL
jgi:uncharacterized protein YjbJ (UPF0337 family)